MRDQARNQRDNAQADIATLQTDLANANQATTNHAATIANLTHTNQALTIANNRLTTRLAQSQEETKREKRKYAAANRPITRSVRRRVRL